MAIDGEKFASWANKQTDVAINKYEKRFYRHINSLGDDIAYYLADVKRIDNLSKPTIDGIIAELVSVQNTRYADAIVDFTDDAARLAAYAAETEVIGMGMVQRVKDAGAIAARTPISASGLLPAEHMAQLNAYNNKRLADTIRQGWAAKTPIDELNAVLIGTEKARYTDGLMHKQKQSARAAIDTACHHTAQVARAEARAANNVYKYRIVATLDNRTSETCRTLDGKVYTYGASNARVPPFHYFCRTVIVPELDKEFSFLSEGRTRSSMYGSVDANITYKEWAEQNKDALAETKQEAKDKAARKRAREKLREDKLRAKNKPQGSNKSQAELIRDSRAGLVKRKDEDNVANLASFNNVLLF